MVAGGNSGGNGNSTTALQGGKDSQRARDDENKDHKEGAAMAQSLRSSGLQAQGLEQGAENYEVGEKTKDFDVRSPATGASQTLTIRGAGQLGEGEQKLGSCKKLDDSPALRYASLHARGQSLEQTANSYAREAAQQGESPDQIRAGVERLKRTTPDSEG